MGNITDRIKRATDELRAIQDEIGAAAVSDPGGKEQERLLDELLKPELIREFKGALDHMRTLMWAYIEAASRKTGEDVDYAIQSFRMQRVTEMLRVLRESGNLPRMVGRPEAKSFLEEIQAMTATRVERHFPAGLRAGAGDPGKGS